MSQFPGFAPLGNNSDVGMSDADDDSSSSVSRTADHFGSSLRISPPPLSIPNPIANYFAVTAAYFPSSSMEDTTMGLGNTSTISATSLPLTPAVRPPPADANPAPAKDVFAAPPPPASTAAQVEVQKAKPQARNKVPLEKGYSQMVWLRLMQTEPDLAGLKGQSRRRLISMDEIKKHKSPEEAWTVLRGRVYNISPYLKFHPGGEDMLMKAAGKDSTALFNKYHAWVNAEFLMEKCMVGLLDVQPQ
ncbi:hypothetical protein MPTK1_3g04390 [Marchantia polymorpha subsp. ruderalis]|uniref:Cytochrome b5 heme-binding domain-containing protein n=2 Tax=Marchantia polymorpha TaxID=3197 RepID=A0AAF6AXD1_MARPO|nr:hypothetical protein MARPO_0022s0092 [Marchantia polymorpha]BBN04415.1 hypothetical protein Mp_3g04390 [Marchantia polymorpha subsp. ruderalis]|eukprot:PTQ43989.1 hypothetical protein MARPO_0022s0092 [Marchantia polymorpha]